MAFNAHNSRHEHLSPELRDWTNLRSKDQLQYLDQIPIQKKVSD